MDQNTNQNPTMQNPQGSVPPQGGTPGSQTMQGPIMQTGGAQNAPLSPVQAGSGGNRRTIILIVVVFIMALVVGLIYVLLIKTSVEDSSQGQATPTQAPLPTATPSPTPLPPNQELNSLDTGDPTQDLDDINRDAQQL